MFNTTDRQDVLHIEETVFGKKRIMGQFSGLHTGLNMTASGAQVNIRFKSTTSGSPGFLLKWKIYGEIFISNLQKQI